METVEKWLRNTWLYLWHGIGRCQSFC